MEDMRKILVLSFLVLGFGLFLSFAQFFDDRGGGGIIIDRDPGRDLEDQPVMFNDFISCAQPVNFPSDLELHKGLDIRGSRDAHPIGRNQALLRQDLRNRSYFSRNLTGVSQFNNRSSWGNNSCAPAAFGSILEYWNRTRFPSIMGGRNITAVIDRLRNLSLTNENGTTLWNFTIGVSKYLNETGYAKNFTFKVFVAGSGENDSTVLGNRSIRNLTVIYIADNDINFTEIVREARTETVILVINFPGVGFHAVALDDYDTAPNPDGTHKISIMDPRLGKVINVTLDDSLGTSLIYPTNETAALWHMISFSPR